MADMKMKHNVPVQSLIDHIKTATDVDPWAKEMAEELLKAPEIIHCHECRYFETKDWWGDWNCVPILVTSECPTCNKWGGGSMTKPDGYCFLAERR